MYLCVIVRAQDAKVLAVENIVQASKGGGGGWKNAAENQSLAVGDRIRTRQRSRATMKLTDLYIADEQQKAAIDGLASTIYAFAEEGRYVPRMLDRLEALCQNVEGSTPALLAFYNTFLPKIPQMRGSSPSKYCITMFERGIAKFKQQGQAQIAFAYEAQLAKIKAGQGQKK